jgi:type II secretory ATPase GspE/PulE/Tfp pilus assembly ATPase PilB-like protein
LPLGSYEIDQKLLEVIPENVARQYCLIGIDRIEDTLTIAMANPLNLQAVEDIQLMTGCKVQTFVSTMTDINTAIDKYYKKKGK